LLIAQVDSFSSASLPNRQDGLRETRGRFLDSRNGAKVSENDDQGYEAVPRGGAEKSTNRTDMDKKSDCPKFLLSLSSSLFLVILLYLLERIFGFFLFFAFYPSKQKHETAKRSVPGLSLVISSHGVRLLLLLV
jgi:hypothetical protein